MDNISDHFYRFRSQTPQSEVMLISKNILSKKPTDSNDISLYNTSLLQFNT